MESGKPRGGRRRRRRIFGNRDAAVPAAAPGSSSPPPAPALPPASPAPVDPVVDGLHVCPACRSGLVQPRSWHDAGPDHWLLERFCPDCWWVGEDRFAQEIMEAFDLALDDGTDALIGALHKLTAERMQDDVELFAAALDADALLPEDF